MAGPDWSAFATAFLTDTAKYINERKDKADDYEEELRKSLEKSKGIMEKRVQLANVVKSKAAGLKGKGIPEEIIRAAAASGPTGLTDLERNWADAESKYGAAVVRANPEMYAVASLTPEEARMTGEGAMSTEQFIEQTYGIVAPTTGSYDAGKSTVWDRMLGRNATERVRAKLDQEMAGMGYSIYDINEAAKAAEYTSLAPGAYVEYKTPKVFTVDDMADEANIVSQQLRNLRTNNPQYAAIEASIEAAQDKLTNAKGVGDGSSIVAAQAELDALRMQQRNMISGYIGPYVQQRSGYFGESYGKIMGQTIDNLVGIDGFTSSLTAQEEEAMAAATEGQPIEGTPPVVTDWESNTVKRAKHRTYGEVAVVKDPSGKERVVLAKPRIIGGVFVPSGVALADEIADEVMKDLEKEPEQPKTTPAEIGTAAAEPVQGGVSKQRRRGGNIGQTGAAMPEPEAPAVPDTMEQSIQIKQSADPEKFYAVKIPGVVGEKKVKGSDLSLIPDEMLGDNVQTVAIREMDEGEDLKTWGPGRLKSAFKTGIASQPVEGRSGPTQRPMVGKNLRQAEADAQERVDEMSDSLLRNSGLEMLDFAREKGLNKESRNEDVLVAITEWAQQNGKQLPMDKGALIYAIKYGLGLR